MTSITAPGVTRRWTRLQDYADEVAVARIYGGFHYRFSNVAGAGYGPQDRGACRPDQAARIERIVDADALIVVRHDPCGVAGAART